MKIQLFVVSLFLYCCAFVQSDIAVEIKPEKGPINQEKGNYGNSAVFNDFISLPNGKIKNNTTISSGDIVALSSKNEYVSKCNLTVQGNQLIGTCDGGIFSQVVIELPNSLQSIESKSLFNVLPQKGIITLQEKYDIDVEYVVTERAGFNQIMFKPLKAKRLGWYTFDDLKFSDDGITFSIDADPEVPITEEDFQILAKVKELLKNPENWNPNDDRKCEDDIANNKYSIYCALETASTDVVGEYNHRNAVMQLMRHLIAEKFPDKKWEHRFKDYNNMPDTDYEKIISLIEEAEKRMKEKG